MVHGLSLGHAVAPKPEIVRPLGAEAAHREGKRMSAGEAPTVTPTRLVATRGDRVPGAHHSATELERPSDQQGRALDVRERSTRESA